MMTFSPTDPVHDLMEAVRGTNQNTVIKEQTWHIENCLAKAGIVFYSQYVKTSHERLIVLFGAHEPAM